MFVVVYVQRNNNSKSTFRLIIFLLIIYDFSIIYASANYRATLRI